MSKVSLKINILRIIPLLLTLQSTKCSVVIDSFSQKSLYVSDYCPSMKYCAEGTHVMCMYYDPHRTYGPQCNNPRNVTITPELANQLLDIINAIRSKVANGKETGFNNTRLPRGYGIFRLKWDSELATFAQITANLCILKHDFCRATKRFPEPGQTAGLVRFAYPGWDPISANNKNTGLNDDKLSYSVAQIVKSWYSQKSFVTEEMINDYPNWEFRAPNLIGRLYLEIIYGSITHMGCGMSAYTEYTYYQNRPSDGRPGGQNFNSIEIICNFSARPHTGQKTYLTSRPKQPYNGECGCPEGSKEDEDCLCNEIPVTREQTKKKGEPEICTSPDNNCEPTLVLLPIFTVEDAPPEKLVERARDIEEPLANYVMDRLDNKSIIMPGSKSVEVLNFYENGDRAHLPAMLHAAKSVLIAKHDDESLRKLPTTPISLPTLKKKMVRHRAEAIPNPEQEHRHEYEHGHEYDHSHEPESEPKQKAINPRPKHSIKRVPTANKSKKSSIFSRAAKFKLPSSRKNIGPYDTIKSDVKPRKDFKKVQRVVNDYLKRQNSKKPFRRHDTISNKHKDKLEKVTLPTTTTIKIEEITEAVLSSAEDKVMNFNQYLKHKNNASVDQNNNFGNEDGDSKLMNLLDTLEREVKHIDLDGNEKEMIHAKIRKIYNSVVGNSNMLDITKNAPIPQPQVFQRREDRGPDILDSMFNDPKAYLKYDTNNIDQKEIQFRNDPLIEEDKNIEKKGRNYDYVDMENKDTKYNKNREGKGYPDIFDDKSFNDNDLFDTDQKIFSDIERKYNERLMHSKLDRKYPDDEYPDRKYVDSKSRNSIKLGSRNQNMYPKYKTILRQRATSGEERKLRAFDKFDKIRDREPRLDFPREDVDRNYYRNIDDERKLIPTDSKKSKYANNDIENPLSSERRKYYQEKLENLEKKLHSSRTYRQRSRKSDVRGNERATRRMRPNLDDVDGMRRMKTKADPFYMPDRARYLHSF